MKRIFLFLSLFSLLFGKEGRELFFYANSFVANNAVSLKTLSSSWEGSYKTPKGGFKSVIFSDFKIGYEKRDFSFAYFWKAEFILKAHKDFADLLYAVKNEEDLEEGRVYNLDLAAEGFVADGVEFGKKVFSYRNGALSLSLNAFFSILNGRFVQDLKIDGFALATAKKSYEFSSRMEYFYSENYVYDLEVNRPRGLGYDTSFSFSLEYGKYSFFVNAENLLGYIYWENAPYSRVRLKSDNAVKDENGYTKYNPTVYGYEGERNFKQRLKSRWSFKAGYEAESFSVFLGEDYVWGVGMPSLEIVKDFKDCFLSLKYETLFDTFTISLKHKNFYVFLGGDTLNLNRAKSVAAGAGIRYLF